MQNILRVDGVKETGRVVALADRFGELSSEILTFLYLKVAEDIMV